MNLFVSPDMPQWALIALLSHLSTVDRPVYLDTAGQRIATCAPDVQAAA